MKTEDSGEGVSARLGQSWAPLELDCAWDDLVLPDEQLELLRTICTELRRRDQAAADGVQRTNGRSSELRVLLTGEPGTGKTLAARVIGAEVGREVVRVSLTRLVEEGAAAVERSLRRVLAASEKSGAITLIDDPEAAFVKRPPASRRHGPAVDPTPLLARFDAHRGPILFASRLKARIDTELIDRLDFVVDLPFPDAEDRGRLWRSSLPADAGVRGQDIDFLSTSFKLSGGAIHECCVSAEVEAAADRVPVDLGHIARGLEREYSHRLLSGSTREAIDELHRRPTRTEVAPRVAADVVPPPGAPAHDARARRVGSGPPTPASRRRRLALLAMGAAVVAGLLGLLVAVAVGGSEAPPAPLDGHASAGPLRVSFPTDWKQRTPPASPALGLTDELALAPPSSTGGAVVIGLATTADASLLPQALLATLPAQPRPQVVSLGGARYYRYLDLAPQGANGPVSVYALPTTVGTLVGVCLKSGAAASFAGECERVLGTARPTSGSVLALGPSATYAANLNAAMSKLNLVRASAGPKLRGARTPAAQAKAANELAAAHKTAAATVTGLSAGPAQAANLNLATALLSTATAYASLARAATRNDTQGYTTASASLTRAQTELEAAFAQLSRLGYAAS